MQRIRELEDERDELEALVLTERQN